VHGAYRRGVLSSTRQLAIVNIRAPFIINFHGVGKPPRAYELGEEPYWVDRVYFENILDFVAQHPFSTGVRLTFDDGNSSDYAIAAPELRRRGLSGSFFVLAGKLGREGYLSSVQVRELSAEGFEIGSHGLNHVVWTNASNAELAREINDSKAILEDITGRSVQSAAVPFGLYDRRVLRELSRHDYHNVFSSDGGPRLTTTLPTPRYSLQRGVDLASLASLIEKSSSTFGRIRTEARLLTKWLIRRGGAS
jgi:peptidoglycan/xylan/chitin deacetylase (PgdA/CDA1 family)